MIYRFLDFELDQSRFELRKKGVPIAVQARVLRALAHLIEQRERVVSKDELIDAVWKDVVVSDTALSQVIMLARKALQDDAEQPTLLKTVRGRGFRFTAQVELQDGPSDRSSELSAPAVARAQPELRSSLVGRSCELQALHGFLDAALAGRGALVTMGGEPGIGKSSLTEAFAAEAAARGIDVLWGRAWEDGGAPPFWPFIQILRQLVERHGPDALHSFAGPQADVLTPLWSEGVLPAAVSGGRARDADGASQRFRLFDAMSRVLRGAAGKGHARAPQAAPRVLVLEDLHACDDASLLMLRFIAQELSGSALLIVATFRDLELPQNLQLRQLLCNLPDSHQVLLQGLPETESLALLERRLGAEPPQRLAAALQQLSGGNPLFVAELARQCQLGSLPQLDQAALMQVAVPERIRSAVHIHLAALPERTLGALTSAAALGRTFSLSLLSQLLDTSEAELLSQLAPAFARGIVRDPGCASGELMFAHALVRNSVYASLSSLRRAQLHHRIGALLEERAGSAAPPLYELAHHYYLGAAVGSKARAIELSLRAAAHAQALRAYETAAELNDRALELSRHEGVDVHQVYLRLLAAGEAWYQAGQLEQAVSRFDQAASMAHAHSESEGHALAVAHGAYALRGAIMYDRPRQQQMCSALRALPEADSPIRAMLLPASVIGRTSPAELEERIATARAGVEMARRLGDDLILAQALNGYHVALWGAVQASELAQVADELLHRARALQHDELVLDALIWRMVNHVELGRGADLHRDTDEYITRVQAHGSWHRYMAVVCESMHEGCLGNRQRADELSLQALRVGQRQGDPLAEGFFAVRQLFRSLHGSPSAGELMPARELPDSVPSMYQTFWLWGWARNGRAEQARAWLIRLGAHGFADLAVDPLRKPLLACLARAAVELGELRQAEQLYTQLAPHAGVHLLLQPGVYIGPVSHHLGVVAAALGRPLVAAEHFEQAQAQCLQLNANAYLLYAQLEHAQLLARELSGKPGRAARSMLPLGAASSARLCELVTSAERLARELDYPECIQHAQSLAEQYRRLDQRVSEAAS